MWKLINNTPFKANYCFYRDDFDGSEVWVIGVKATFNIEGSPSGNLSIAKEQTDVFLTPQYIGQEGESSLLYDSDLVLKKDFVDIILNGHAYAQEAETRNIKVNCHIGYWSKTLNVFGDRLWGRALGLMFKTPPEEFSKMPLTYENSYGGASKYLQKNKNSEPSPVFDIRNPVGRGFKKRKSELIGQRMPNIEYPDNKTTLRNPKKNRVASFGAIPSYWKPRIDFAGTYSPDAKVTDSLTRPKDFDTRYYNSAPLDQQVKSIEKGTAVRLTNLTSEGDLIFYLPSVDIHFKTWMNNKHYNHKGVLHSLIIEPDVPRIMMLWQTSLKCQYQEQLIEDSVITSDVTFNNR